jgi:hypothetical protein
MTPYRERREAGEYDPKGEGTKSTTTDNLSGLGAPQATTKTPITKKPSAKKK